MQVVQCKQIAGSAVAAAVSRLRFTPPCLRRATRLHLSAVRMTRKALGVEPSMKRVDTCAAEFEAGTPYMYSSYDGECECESDAEPKVGLLLLQHQPPLPTWSRFACEPGMCSRRCAQVLILGGGPNRIGQGIEFDYCCCHASFSLRDAGYETIMMNSNPETVSTDYDTSSRLYFEPLTVGGGQLCRCHVAVPMHAA